VIAAIRKPHAHTGHQYNRGEWLITRTSWEGALGAGAGAGAGLGELGGVVDMGSLSLLPGDIATKRT
jgi:hypothetical protein